MLRFEYPDFLWLLVLIPVLIIAFIMIRKWRLKTLGKYGNLNLISGLAPETSNVKPAVKFMLLMLALGTLLLGLADLQVGTKLAVAKKQGQDIIVAIDVSNSMLAKDSPSESAPTRLELAKFAVSKLIDKLKGDQIGFIVFAGEAAVHMPLTSDYSAARLFLSTVDPELIPVQGTAIASAIDEAMTSFNYDEDDNNNGKNEKTDNDDKNQKILILITDGENHEKDAIEDAAKAAEKGLRIFTIGMGLPTGSPIPDIKNGVRTGDYLRDENGNIVISKLNEGLLEKIARIGNGEYIRDEKGDPDLARMLKQINKADKKEFETKKFSEYEDRFQYFLAFTFIFLTAEFFIKERRNRLLSKFNFFGE